MHTPGVLLLLTIGFLANTKCEKEIIRFAFFYPFNSIEINHPEGYNITTVLDYGMQLFNASVYGEKYELRYSVFNTNCTAKEGNRAYIEMLQQTNSFPFIIGNKWIYKNKSYTEIIGVTLCSYLLSTEGISLFIGMSSVESR